MKRNLKVVKDDNAEVMTIMPLGGGQEVGRSCILLQYQGRNIMLDCGCHPGREGSDGLPFFDSLDDPGEIDLILITHFHIDHCAALPYFTEKTNFKGRIFMTHATKAVMKLLLADNIRLQFKSAPLYSEQDLNNCIDKIEVVDYHQTIEYKGIKFTATAAGHVLGAAMFMIDIDSIKVLYTGDYSLEEDRHLIQASVPAGGPPDVLIVESTFGVTNIPPREKRELDFTNTVESIVRRGGSCLIPVFALGRAQELLLILDEYWRDNAELQSVPVLYASKLATKSLRVYQTFINMMNGHIRGLMDTFSNPFKLKHVRSIQNNDFESMGPSVVMAAPGFMQSGVSRQLLEQWCDNDKNGVIIAGYTIEGTQAHDLLTFPTTVRCLDGRIKPRRCQIEYIAFSAHVDGNQNRSYIKSVMPDYIILVHGERTQMDRLKSQLIHDMKKDWSTVHKPSIATPENGVKVKLRFRKTIAANVIGTAATNMLTSMDQQNAAAAAAAAAAAGSTALVPTTSHPETGVVMIPDKSILVTENFTSKLVAANELATYTNCRFNRIVQRLVIPIPRGLGFVDQSAQAQAQTGSTSAVVLARRNQRVTEQLLLLMVDALEEIFDHISINHGLSKVKGTVNSVHTANTSSIIVEDLITLSPGYASPQAVTSTSTSSSTSSSSSSVASPEQLTHVNIEWYASPIADAVADCIAASMAQLFSTQNALKLSMAAQSFSHTASAHHNKRRKVTDVSSLTGGGNATSTDSDNPDGDFAVNSTTVPNNKEKVDIELSSPHLLTKMEDDEEERDEPLPLATPAQVASSGVAAVVSAVEEHHEDSDAMDVVADDTATSAAVVEVEEQMEATVAADTAQPSVLLQHTSKADGDEVEEDEELSAEEQKLTSFTATEVEAHTKKPLAENMSVASDLSVAGGDQPSVEDVPVAAAVVTEQITPSVVSENVVTVPAFEQPTPVEKLLAEAAAAPAAVVTTASAAKSPSKPEPSSQSQSKAVKQEVIDKMQAGLIDPSKAIPTEIRAVINGGASSSSTTPQQQSTVSSTSTASTGPTDSTAGNGTASSISGAGGMSGADVAKAKLRSLHSQLLAYNEATPLFSSIAMNTTGNKLIFRSLPNKRYLVTAEDTVELKHDKKKLTTVGAFEAFCFIMFGDGEADGTVAAAEGGAGGGAGEDNKHHAVVECVNDGFRKAILHTLAHLA